MSERRLFCSRRRIEDGVCTITGDEAYHGLKVLRLRAGDSVCLFTEQGSEFRCTVIDTGKSTIRAEIVEKLTGEVESPLKIHLIQGMPKAAKLEQVIVHGTELGMTSLQPLVTERSVKTGEKRDRWRKLALEATKQSGRRIIPHIEHLTTLERYSLNSGSDDAGTGHPKLIAVEPPGGGSLRSIIANHPSAVEISLAIGPEGGFTDEEIETFTGAGFQPFTLGPRVFRTQTASLAIIAILQYERGDWDQRDES